MRGAPRLFVFRQRCVFAGKVNRAKRLSQTNEPLTRDQIFGKCFGNRGVGKLRQYLMDNLAQALWAKVTELAIDGNAPAHVNALPAPCAALPAVSLAAPAAAAPASAIPWPADFTPEATSPAAVPAPWPTSRATLDPASAAPWEAPAALPEAVEDLQPAAIAAAAAHARVAEPKKRETRMSITSIEVREPL